MAKKGQTRGRVKNVMGFTRVYYKPTLGKLIFRNPGVNRQSDAVIARNKKVAEAKPASKCKGKKWPDFVACLREEMEKI